MGANAGAVCCANNRHCLQFERCGERIPLDMSSHISNADDTSVLADVDIGSGSYSTCDGPLSPAQCPSQCVWCGEAQLCTALLQDCFLPAPRPGASGDVVLLWVCIGALLCLYAFLGWQRYLRRKPSSPVAASENESLGEYQLGGVVASVRNGEDAVGRPSASSIEQAESQSLLS